MGALGGVLLGVGGLLMLVGTVLVLIRAFGESVWWGLGSLFVPFVILIFAVMNFADCKKGLLLWGVGIVLYGVGIGVMVGNTAMQSGIS